MRRFGRVRLESTMGGPSSDCSSSGEEDGDAEWKAAISSVAATTVSNGSAAKPARRATQSGQDDDEEQKQQPQSVKLYQIKAQKILEDIIEKSLVVVRDPIHVPEEEDPRENEGGVRLFKNAPRGIVFDHTELERPDKKPRLLPGEEIDEKSKKFKRQIRSVAVEGEEIIAAARNACQKSLARLEAKDVAAKAAAKREEERVAELKKLRGEKWLPSIAREMRLNIRSSK